MHRFFIFSSLPLVFCSSYLFAFWSCFAGISCVRTRSNMGSDTAMYEVLFCCSLHMSVACFVLWKWMDVNMIDTIILRLHPTRDSPNNACLVANAWCIWSTRYDVRSKFGISTRERPSGKQRQVLHNFGPAGHENDPPAGSWKFSKRRIRGPDPRARSAGPTGGSADSNSRVMVTRSANDPYLTSHDPTRPVTF